ncbi:MAG: hypothetical protein ACFFF4_14880 [Candidatus Thorarchaeota archaeon]
MSEAVDDSTSIEEMVFKTLGHQIRRDILRFIGEQKSAKFTEIKRATGIEESASLSYHLSTLTPLMLHDDDLYKLSTLGKDVYTLMSKLVTYSETAEILGGVSKQLGATIVANALLWASALMYMMVVEGPLEMLTLGAFAALFSTSNLILYSNLQSTSKR